MLIVAKEDRKLRIEEATELEGVLPDAKAKDIIDEVIVPYFKNGDFYGGVKVSEWRSSFPLIKRTIASA